ncbi:hypothetical protein FACS189443_1630 [Planctomycetales bacterium]|nr:hypothetical protein FACS189443_1630 [Planctomycetales bacterium]
MNSKQLLTWAKSKKWEKVKNSLDTVNTIDSFSLEIIQSFLYAVFDKQYDIVKQFIDVGVDVNAVCPQTKQFALSMAALKADDKMIQLLVENGANLNLQSESSFPALYTLLVRAEKFCFGGVAHPVSGDTVAEARSIFMDSITIFLDNNVNLNTRTNINNKTALDWGASLRWSELIQLFLDHGASVSECQYGGYEALVNVMELNDIESFGLLFGHNTISQDIQYKIYTRALELERHIFIDYIKCYYKNCNINNKDTSSSIRICNESKMQSTGKHFFSVFNGHYKISTGATSEMYIQKRINIFRKNVKPSTLMEDEIRTFWLSREDDLAVIELIIDDDGITLQNGSDTEKFHASFFHSGEWTHVTIDWFGNSTEFRIENIGDGLIHFEPQHLNEHELSEAVWEKI